MKACDSGIGAELDLAEPPDVSRDDFSPKIKGALAKRAAFECAICGASTVGPSRESPEAVTNIGVAAHIAGARPGSARYDPAMTSAYRSRIENAIWLCQTHAKAIDDDAVTWPVQRLRVVKEEHEKAMLQEIGVATKQVMKATAARKGPEKVAQEFGFLRVGDMLPAYRTFLQPMLEDQRLTKDDELGILMTSLPAVRGPDGSRVPWTVFVHPEWLRDAIAGKSETAPNGAIPERAIYGRVPGWPDEFLEFLEAIVRTGVTFRWERTPQGHLALEQTEPVKQRLRALF